VEFQNATVGEVLQWLTHKGVNFVAAEAEVDRGAKITLNVQNAPLEDVVNSIASALGGHWVRQGEMRVFRKGFRFMPGEPGMPGNVYAPRMDFMKPGDVQVYGWNKEDQEKFRKQMEQLHKDMSKVQVETLRQFGKGQPGDVRVWQHQMSKEDHEKLMKEMEQLHKEMPKIRSEALKELERYRGDKNLSDAERARIQREVQTEVERAMKEHSKAMEELRKNGYRTPDGQPFMWRGGDKDTIYYAPRLDKKALEEMKKSGNYWGPGGPSIFFDGKGRSMLTLRQNNLKQLINGLSPEQLEKHRRQGYLTPRDLTESQRKLLNVQGNGDWTMIYKVDGKEITIKNK
jgi:hypothetical protein